MFKRILIANRGEIALRIMRTAREMGIETVAVYSDFDRSSLHARFADAAVSLGGALPSESYLNVEKILQAARQTHADAVHPGYGFLAENADFAREVEAAGLIWVGPPPEAIRDMGDKIASRQIMERAGVPVVPGLKEPLADVSEAVAAAEEVGYPIALKAAAGGGGKGIRIVHDPDDMGAALRAAAGEAETAFGDGRVYLERYLDRPRHIEIQVLFDTYGNGVHLGERECSVQRRHQKLLEESPSSAIDGTLREAMGKVALDAARAAGYVGAGTVEFLFREGESGPEFFFLEMNTRLQVEHPVTEMVTGLDLVREQLRVAAGEPLGFEQGDVKLTGHAIEVRINAEDPSTGFLPSTGTVRNLRWPGGPWVRIDSCLYRGMEVGLNYDPLLAKVIVWGPARMSAIERMRRTLQELNVGGVRTGASAAMAVLENESFRSGAFDTGLLESMDLKSRVGSEVAAVAVAAAVHRWHLTRRSSLVPWAGDRRAWLERGRRQDSDWSGGGQA